MDPNSISRLRTAIVILNIIALLCSLPLITTMFAYGGAESGLMFLYLPTCILLFISTYIIIRNAKIGYILDMIAAIICFFILSIEIVSDFENNDHIIFLFPVISFVLLILITIIYFTKIKKNIQNDITL